MVKYNLKYNSHHRNIQSIPEGMIDALENQVSPIRLDVDDILNLYGLKVNDKRYSLRMEISRSEYDIDLYSKDIKATCLVDILIIKEI